MNCLILLKKTNIENGGKFEPEETDETEEV